MLQRKNIALCIILSFLTCGIYSLYWFVTLTDDVNQLSGDAGTSGGIALVFLLLSCGLYGFYWAYKMGERIDAAKQTRGIPSGNSGILYIILMVFSLSIISYAIMQNEINKFAGPVVY